MSITTIRDFNVVLGMIERGELVDDLGRDLVETLRKTKEVAERTKGGKASGTVTLKLSLTVENGSVTIEPEISTKAPKSPRGRSFFFVTDDGELSTEHPRQHDIFGPRPVSSDRPRA